MLPLIIGGFYNVIGLLKLIEAAKTAMEYKSKPEKIVLFTDIDDNNDMGAVELGETNYSNQQSYLDRYKTQVTFLNTQSDTYMCCAYLGGSNGLSKFYTENLNPIIKC